MHYDYLIAGAGLFGAVFAHEMHKQGRKVLVSDVSYVRLASIDVPATYV